MSSVSSFKGMQKEYEELQEARIYYKKYTEKLNDIIDDLRAKIEEETKIRKIFENKLNDLHSIVRDKEAGYKRAQLDLDHILQNPIDKDNLLSELRVENKEANQNNVAYQIKYDTINHLLNNTKKELQDEKLEKMRVESYLKDELAKVKSKLRANEKELDETKSQLKDKSFRYDCIFKVLEREQKEIERLKNIPEDTQDTNKLEDKIRSLTQE